MLSLHSTIRRLPVVRSIYRRAVRVWKRWRFWREFVTFSRMSRADVARRFRLRWRDRSPFLDDSTPSTGFDRHYVYHTAWAARVLARLKPDQHVDISSSLFFCGLVSAFVHVRFYDYRPPALQLDNLEVDRADLTCLPFADGSIASLSCMHVVEHVGLGRYGDRLQVDGDLVALRELQRVVAPGGSLLLVVPVGRPRIQFNAHRIYSHRQVLEQFPAAVWDLREFAMIPEKSTTIGLLLAASPEQVEQEKYACGCYWFQKRAGAG